MGNKTLEAIDSIMLNNKKRVTSQQWYSCLNTSANQIGWKGLEYFLLYQTWWNYIPGSTR